MISTDYTANNISFTFLIYNGQLPHTPILVWFLLSYYVSLRPLRFQHKTMFGSSLPPLVCRIAYVICTLFLVYFRTVVYNSYCEMFLFYFSSLTFTDICFKTEHDMEAHLSYWQYLILYSPTCILYVLYFSFKDFDIFKYYLFNSTSIICNSNNRAYFIS